MLAAARTTLTIAALLLLTSPATASTLYRYVGNPFTLVVDNDPPPGSFNSSMFVEVLLEFEDPLAPNLDVSDAVISGNLLSFSFTDGMQTITEAEATSVVARFSTDSNGGILEWGVQAVLRSSPSSDPFEVGDTQYTIDSFSSINAVRDSARNFVCLTPTAIGGCGGQSDLARVTRNPGMWTVVPEPSTGLLVGLGLAAAGMRGRRRRSQTRAR